MGKDACKTLVKCIETFRVRLKAPDCPIQGVVLSELETLLDDLRGELRALRCQETPKTLAGWSLNRHARGYWRAFRKIAGKSRCIYLGVRWDESVATEKLRAANEKYAKPKTDVGGSP